MDLVWDIYMLILWDGMLVNEDNIFVVLVGLLMIVVILVFVLE